MIHDIARTLEAVRFEALSAPAQEKLLLCVLANGSVARAGVPATRVPAPAPDPSGTHVLFDGSRTADARAAAFYNAAAMHARTQDDFHPIGNLHIATVVLPALLAAAAQAPGTGARFLDALAAGYAAAVGLSRRFSPLTTPRGLRSTCLYAPFGATAAVARQHGFDAARTANALALTASLVGGTTQCWIDGSDEYQLHVGQAASNALLACALTQAGFKGGDHALDGRAGLFPALVGVTPRFADIAADFEPGAAVLDTVLKRYPVSGICQPVVLACERLAARTQGRTARSARLVMRAFELGYPGTDNRGPFTSFSDRLMSARYCTASVLRHGGFDFEAFTGPADEALLALVAAIEITGDPDLPPLSCSVQVVDGDGRTWSEEVVDGGSQLAIDGSTVDAWAAPMWRGSAGGEAGYAAFRDAVRGLPEAVDSRALMQAVA